MANHEMGIPMKEVWLEALAAEPGIIEIYLDYQLSRSKAYVKARAEHGVDFIMGGGDLATDKGPVYSPDQFKEIFVPRFKELVDFCHNLGIPYVFRSDGNTKTLWEHFRAIGVDGIGEIDVNAGMDLKDLRLYFGKKVVLFGNVDCMKTLIGGTKEEIQKSRHVYLRQLPGADWFCLLPARSIMIFPRKIIFLWLMPGKNTAHIRYRQRQRKRKKKKFQLFNQKLNRKRQPQNLRRWRRKKKLHCLKEK